MRSRALLMTSNLLELSHKFEIWHDRETTFEVPPPPQNTTVTTKTRTKKEIKTNQPTNKKYQINKKKITKKIKRNTQTHKTTKLFSSICTLPIFIKNSFSSS